MKNSISLIGMAGSGKTTIGMKLSEILNLSFSDSDNVIETKYGKTLQSILDSDGYMGLRAIEENAILSIKIDHVVLATGGSAVYSTKAMEYLKMNSLIIFLEVPFDQIMERVSSFLDRGFAKEPNQSIEDAFLERQSLYANYADHIIVNTESIDSCVSKILNLL
jgi:shikimate kinase